MRAALSSLIFMTLAASSYVTAEGINCEGSSDCILFKNPVAETLSQQVAQVDDNRVFQNGEHIACTDGNNPGNNPIGSICAFLQGTGGIQGSAVKTLAQRIVEHGCKNCGSVPVFFDQGDNDVNTHGELTFNFVGR